MKNLTLRTITEATGGSYCGPEEKLDLEISSISTDSRKIERGALFVAIPGERVDGHSFIPQVMEKGALGVISEKEPTDPAIPTVTVGSSLQAVKDIAEFYLRQLAIPVVGIVGSVGKTSTKEMTASVLGQKYRVRKTEGNFNNELGMPLTIFRLSEEDQIAVLEMGISDFGEMHRLAKIARPDTVLFTNVGTCHLDNLKDRDGVLRAKSEVFDFMGAGNHIVLNGDDDKLATLGVIHGIRPIRFGLNASNDLYADQIVTRGFSGTDCTLHMTLGGKRADLPVHIAIPGRHMVYNALAGAAAGLIYGLSGEEIRRGIEECRTISGRFHVIETDRLTIVDDCYNANPMSMRASLDILQDGKGRKVAVLGDMGELGEETASLHEGVGRYAAERQIDALYCAGTLSEGMAEAASKTDAGLDVRHFQSRDALMQALPELLHDGDTVLVKASHFMHYEKIVELLQTF